MSGAGVRNEPSPDSIKYRQGLDAFFANDKATAVAALGAVAKDQPANGLAATYLRKANALPDPVTRAVTPPTPGRVLGSLLPASAADCCCSRGWLPCWSGGYMPESRGGGGRRHARCPLDTPPAHGPH